MGCNSCHQEVCGCMQDLNTYIYRGMDLDCIEVESGFTMDAILQKINEKMCELQERLIDPPTTPPPVNQPPSVVGNYVLNLPNRGQSVLTLDMFTTLTTPAYSDPENDPINAVRIDTITIDGVLTLNGVNVTEGQIISATDINNGLLVYNSPNQDTADQDMFTFSVRDSGSNQFRS